MGSILNFVASGPPIVITDTVTGVTANSATLNGTVNPNGNTATAWFRYSSTNPGICNDAFGTRAPSAGGFSAGSGTSNIGYSNAITGLSVGTTYYYCAIAQNSAGTSVGSVLTFIAANPVIFLNFYADPINPVLFPNSSTLTAETSYTGDVSDTMNYTFWWNCSNPSNSVATATADPSCGDPLNPTNGNKFNSISAPSDNTQTTGHSYPVGTYSAKVIVERGAATPVQRIIIIVVEARPDLIISTGSFTPISPLPADTMSFLATVKNDGSAASGASSARLRIDQDNNGTWDVNPANQDVGNLAVNATQNVSWNNVWVSVAGIHAYEICADPLNAVSEGNEINNCFSRIFSVGFCTSECLPSGINQCYSIRTYQDCGEYDAINETVIDTCLEWGPEAPDLTAPDTPCPPRNTCVAGLCVPAPNWIEVAPQRNE